MNPSPRVSVCRSGREHSWPGFVSTLQGRISTARQAAGQSLQWPMRREVSVAWSSTVVCDAQVSQQWSGACLCYTLKVVYSTLLGPFHKSLGTPDASVEFAQKPVGGIWLLSLTPCWHVGSFPRSLSLGGPAPQTWLL